MPIVETITIRIVVDEKNSYSETKKALNDEFMRQYLTLVMERHENNITKVAAAIKTDRRFLGKLVKKYVKP
jgi:transcriptional regulator with PAS, ATPase and Fis domain